MKTIEDINLHQWFVDRELVWAPDHFTNCTTPANSEARAWILEKLRGRFHINLSFCPAFEDSKEAMFYELTWG
jgi:hypothetical protein